MIWKKLPFKICLLFHRLGSHAGLDSCFIVPIWLIVCKLRYFQDLKLIWDKFQMKNCHSSKKWEDWFWFLRKQNTKSWKSAEKTNQRKKWKNIFRICREHLYRSGYASWANALICNAFTEWVNNVQLPGNLDSDRQVSVHVKGLPSVTWP